jgi:hypothetical protein
MEWRRSSRRLVAVSALAVAGLTASTIGAAGAVTQKTLAKNLAGPLQLSVSARGVLVGQSFGGAVTVVGPDGSLTNLVEGQAVDAVAWQPGGAALFTSTDPSAADAQGVAQAELRRVDRNGTVHTIADTRAYEEANNPDAGNHYGLQDLDPDCASQLPPGQEILPYTGVLDSHPYAIATVGSTAYIADAAGNDILAVDANGAIRTVAVLPPQPLVVTADQAAANHLPDCIVGKTFNFEPVPTDVEFGPGGLYVSTLPGGPEGPSLGARGSVYKINPVSGRARRIATGFAGATNLAIGPNGAIYVAELFGNQVSRVVNGHGVPVVSIKSPAAVEYWNGDLYISARATTHASGKILRITL